MPSVPVLVCKYALALNYLSYFSEHYAMENRLHLNVWYQQFSLEAISGEWMLLELLVRLCRPLILELTLQFKHDS